ncbi:MAG: ABC transporter ATP-binding protein [Synoicihabitans sp.]
MSGDAIEFDGVTKEYPLPRTSARVRALDGVSVTIPVGAVVGVLGPNGSGKTTFLDVIAGLTRASSGRAMVLGRPSGDRLVREQLGYASGEGGLPDHLTGHEALMWWARLRGDPLGDARERSQSLLERVGLAGAGARRRGDYSRGMKQRLAWAQAIMFSPPLVILDEPYAGIDVDGMDTLDHIIADLKRDGTTVVFSSHQLQSVANVCDRVVLLTGGKLLAEGDLLEMAQTPNRREIRMDEIYREKWSEARKVQ